jgi:hypothetical protein
MKPERLQTLRLDAGEIIRTIDRLRERIEERFPDSGLGRIAADVGLVGRATMARLDHIARPNLPLRVGTGLVIVLILGVLLQLVTGTRLPDTLDDAGELVQVLESALNDVFLIGAALFFLITIEARIKRRRALRFLRELRGLAHIVDMHQLTKDPERVASRDRTTASSPRRDLSSFELSRYLDYCSELLSLISKIAALYAQNLDDPVVLAAVDEVENLTTGLARNIWQKIVIIGEG